MSECSGLIDLIPFEYIEKYALSKGRKCVDEKFVNKNFDIKIVASTQSNNNGMNITFGNSVFTKYSYIVFYAMKNTLVFKLTNDYDALNTYTISQNPKRPSVYCTKVAGKGYEKLERFIGTHKMQRYIGSAYETPIFYIEKPISKNDLLSIL